MFDRKERLKSLKKDELFKTSVDDELTKSWQNNPEIKIYILKKINSILKEVFEPINMWRQNPNSKNDDFGVVINNEWSELNQVDTNYSCHTFLFNRCNQYLVSLYRKRNIEEIIIDGEIFTYKHLFIFNSEMSNNEIILNLERIFKLIRYNGNKIFSIGSESYNGLCEICNRTMGVGDRAQKFYENDIKYFFPDLLSYTSSNGKGHFNDRKQGIDIWKEHETYKSTDQVKLIKDYYFDGDNYIIDVVISNNSNITYYVFVVNFVKILILKNDVSLIKFGTQNITFPKELFYKEKDYV